MLILDRTAGESIMIGDDITITVMGTDRNRVKMGIKAPRGVPVHREEVYDAIRKEQGLPPMKRNKASELRAPSHLRWHNRPKRSK